MTLATPLIRLTKKRIIIIKYRIFSVTAQGMTGGVRIGLQLLSQIQVSHTIQDVHCNSFETDRIWINPSDLALYRCVQLYAYMVQANLSCYIYV